MPSQPLIHCPGCGALVPGGDGPTHRYIGASPGCWAIYGEVTARGYAEAGLLDDRMLTVNTYAVQHPGLPSPQSVQSVAVHLIGLYLVLERDFSRPRTLDAVRRAADGSAIFRWLDPPVYRYPLTILDVHRALGAIAYQQTLWAWARVTWEGWAAHQSLVRAWAAELQIA